jgi:hypothetical protein
MNEPWVLSFETINQRLATIGIGNKKTIDKLKLRGYQIMCFKNDVDSILQQLRGCHDSTKMRQLLEELDACKECPEAEGSFARNNIECSYRIRLRIKMNNLVEYLILKK